MRAKTDLTGQKKEAFYLTEIISEDMQGTKYLAKHDNGIFYNVKHIPYPSDIQLKAVKDFFKKDQILTDNFFSGQIETASAELEKIKIVTAECAHLERVKSIIVSRRPDGYPYDIFICTTQYDTLASHISGKGLSTADALRIAKNALDGLCALHDVNLLHGNLNSESIVCGEQNSFMLGNYSAIRPQPENIKYLTADGTNAYMPPETINDGIYDVQSEVYALGMVVYMLFNNNEFPFGNAGQTIKESANEVAVPLPARATEDLGKVIIKALTNRNARYKNAREFYEALEKAQSYMDMNALMVPLFAPENVAEPVKPEDNADVISLDNPVVDPLTDVTDKRDGNGLAKIAFVLGIISVSCVFLFSIFWLIWGKDVYNRQRAEQIMTIELSETEMVVRAGSKFVIPLSEIPESDQIRLHIESDNPSVATVTKSGEITAWSPGTANISIIQDKEHVLATMVLTVY